MKSIYLAWTFIFLCAKVVPGLALENPHMIRERDMDFPTYNLLETEKRGRNGTVKWETYADGRKLLATNDNIGWKEKARRTKGCSCGGNTVYWHNADNSSVFLHRPSFFISATIICFSISSLLVYPFPLT
ncbi:uncharacterized protein LOC111371874 [Olea europaea var. sylvestris]|uniref:uncharacterized protein LOC111371874 n=1 Tax=Olea europaea var. sylvestris TaxID=158386 RepID=UPI000C1D1065|nr:uncharacterized protein LOC111371874 [Olea europaea var. sylvestris]